MSAAVGSANKANVFNEENEALYDPYWGFALPPSFVEIPWPEWNDAELNAEAWDEGKGRAATAAAGKKDFGAVPGFVFEDADPPCLPRVIRDSVFSWKRPQEVFAGAIFTVYEPTNSEFELSVPSPIAECDFFTCFKEHLSILQFYALKYGFPVELETPKFVANTQGEPWRPWHHVYAMCKAGKGQIHKPLYCPLGKYVLRIFYMGTWRRILVDDRIPCDKQGNCMLPTTQIPGELWPILLTKALLKILSLTPTWDLLAADFPLLSFFTGWPRCTVTTTNKTVDQVWRRLLALTPAFELPHDAADLEAKSLAPSVKNLLAKRDSKKESRPPPDRKESQTDKFCFLLAAMEGFPDDQKYTVALTMTRDCPLVKLNRRESTKPWKRIRWVNWAKSKGLWTDENLLPPYRRLHCINFVKDLADFLAPDPRQESVLYDIATDDDQTTEDDLSNDEDNIFDPEQWCDYLKFKHHLTRMDVFFKPSFFWSSFKVTCPKDNPPEAPATGKSTGKPPPPQNLFFYPPILKPTCNEPLLVFCESSAGIFLSISLWVCPKKPKSSPGYLEGDHPEVLKVGHGCLIVERFLWKTFQQGELVGMTKTVGNSSLALNLKPGRHVLKLWLNCDSPYVVDVYSNVNVVVQRRSRIHFLMTNESERISSYIANVSNAFIALTQKFGKSDLPSALHEFYSAIRPGNDGAIDYSKKIDDFIETFLNCTLLSLKDAIPNAEELKVMMWALQSLFLNPDIRCDLPPGGPPSSVYGGARKVPAPKKVVTIVNERTLSDILEYPWTPEEVRKVVLVQRVFRGFRVRSLWKRQAPARKEFKPYAERLKKICDTLFVPSKREQEVGMLLRRMLMAKPDLLTTFRFHEDFSNVVQLEEYTGKVVNVEPFAWVPLARFVIACHSEHLVPCALDFFCNLEKFVVQAFDNDTNQEIFRLANQVSPHYYRSNVRGYTVFAFGWNEANLKTVNWKLELVRMKYFQAVHLCNMLLDLTCRPYAMPNLDVLEVRNFYVPNSKRRICRCFIKVQKRTLLTLRFSTSYSEAHFVVTILLDESSCPYGWGTNVADRVVARISSTNGAVLVSSLVLDFVESPRWEESRSEGESTVYVVEVSVINNSWPLTKQEWGVVEPLRVNGESWKDSTSSLQSKRGGSDSRKKLTRMSKRSVSEQKPVESPFWLMQVLNESTGSEAAGEGVSVEEDKSHVESVRAMKLSWEEKDPGRRKRGREMRRRFLTMMFLEERRNAVGEGEGEGEGEGYCGECEGGMEDVQGLIDRMGSFSYLTNDLSPTRYTYSPRTLPVVQLFQLLCKYCRLYSSEKKGQEGSEFDGGLSDKSGKWSKTLFEELDEEMKDFLNQRMHFRSVMVNYTNAEQKLSSELMEEAYEGRQRAIERMVR